LDPDRYAPGSFDVVTTFEVLEHMADPRREVRSIARVLRPGGVLYATTPNFSSLTRRLLGPRYRVIDYPEHLGYFRRSTLDRLLCEAGFTRIDLRSTGFSVGQVYAGLHSGPATGARSLDESVRGALESTKILGRVKHGVNRGLSGLALGDTLKAIYQRA
jgi:SAM-dependent methyltransferase